MAMTFINRATTTFDLALAVLALSLSNLHTSASAFTFTSLTEEELIEKFISQDGSVEFSNINASPHILNCTRFFTGGHDMGYAWLNDDNVTLTNAHLLPDEGIMLSSGNPLDFIYNDLDFQTTVWGNFPNDTLYDEDLANAINDTRVFDACFLEFDFKCSGEGYVPQVSFKYMFGSDEYHEFVNSSFNDAFAFLLNGVNIAKLPSTETDVEVVSINNVNLQLNRQYFHGNDPDCTAGVCMVYPQIEPDGFTVILTALGTPHQNPDQTNTIKLVVGDLGDAALDSWVLLEGSSFSCVDNSAPTHKPSGKSGKSSGQPTTTNMPSSSSKSGKSLQSVQPSPSIAPSESAPSSEPSLAPSSSSSSSSKSGKSLQSVQPSPSIAPSESVSVSPVSSFEPSLAPSPSSSSSKSGKSFQVAQPSPSIAPSESVSVSPVSSSEPSLVPSPSSSSSKSGKSLQVAQPSPSIAPSESVSVSPVSSSEPSLAPSPSSSSSKSGKSLQVAQPSPSIAPSESASSSEPSLAPSESSEPPSVKPSSEPSLAPSKASEPPSDKPSSEPSLAPSVPAPLVPLTAPSMTFPPRPRPRPAATTTTTTTTTTSNSNLRGRADIISDLLSTTDPMAAPAPAPASFGTAAHGSERQHDRENSKFPSMMPSSSIKIKSKTDKDKDKEFISDLLGTDPMAAAFGTTAAHGSQRENSKAPSMMPSSSRIKSKTDKDKDKDKELI